MHDPCARSRCLQKITTQHKNTLLKAPVWSRSNTLRRLSQKSYYNSRVLERSQSRVPFYEEDVGAFYSSEVLPPFLVEQVSSLQGKSSPCRASLILTGQVFKNLKLGGQVWAFVLSGAPHKEWARPSLGPWTWACWARQALSHILSSSAAPFTPFGPSLLCKRSTGVTIKTNNNDGPVLMGVTDRHK